MSKPTIVLVHGFWAGAAQWGGVITELAAKGYDIKAVDLPLTSLADDAERTRKMVKQIEGNVLLVGHSYGGAVITEASSDLSNVVGLVYIAAFAPDKDESLSTIVGQFPSQSSGDGSLIPDSDGYLWFKSENFHQGYCHDATEEQALIMNIAQKAPVASAFGDNVTKTPGWRLKPNWYQIATDDRCITRDAQKFMADRMKTRKTIEFHAGHASNVTQPGKVAALIDEAATELKSA